MVEVAVGCRPLLIYA